MRGLVPLRSSLAPVARLRADIELLDAVEMEPDVPLNRRKASQSGQQNRWFACNCGVERVPRDESVTCESSSCRKVCRLTRCMAGYVQSCVAGESHQMVYLQSTGHFGGGVACFHLLRCETLASCRRASSSNFAKSDVVVLEGRRVHCSVSCWRRQYPGLVRARSITVSPSCRSPSWQTDIDIDASQASCVLRLPLHLAGEQFGVFVRWSSLTMRTIFVAFDGDSRSSISQDANPPTRSTWLSRDNEVEGPPGHKARPR